VSVRAIVESVLTPSSVADPYDSFPPVNVPQLNDS
jgi:hypothetical protein